MQQSKLICELHSLASKDNFTFDNLKDNNTIIVCGAGISIESKLPSGWDLIKKVLDTFDLGHKCKIDLVGKFENYNKDVISKIQNFHIKLYDAPRLEVLFKCLKDILTQDEYDLAVQGFLFYNYKENIYNESVYSNYQHFVIADFIKNNGKVLTANFDNLIEHAIFELDKSIKYSKINFPLEKQQRIDEEKGALIKYHGDINEISTIGIDISNLRVNGFGDDETLLFDSIFKNISNIIFIGFSISDTLDLVPYLKSRGNDLTYFYFNFTNSSNSSMNKFHIPKFGKTIEAYEYFYSKNTNCYVVNNFLNEIQKRANPYQKEQSIIPAFQLNNANILNMQSFISLLSDTTNSSHLAIKMNILKSYGLLNLIDSVDLNSLTENLKPQFFDHLQNINGNYKHNLLEILKRKEDKDFEFLKFGALQEYVFLDRKHTFERIRYFFSLSIVFLALKRKLKSERHEINTELKLNRCVCLYLLRLFQLLSKLKLSKIVPKFIILNYETLILRQVEIAKKLNDLMIYKFAVKEHFYVKGLFNHIFKIPEVDLIEELNNIYELNIDTNYFIEANNLLRFGATEIAPAKYKDLLILSTELTKDYLNLSKVKNRRQNK